ncbi:hypothetical protein KFE98_07065 [bacterium SCSIO 12741]|nr:hypothetical protein KFE98_07065 [bacterium SCSIO 12741]
MEALDKVVKAYQKNGFEDGQVVEALKALREEFKTIGNPTLTKVCRLAYEHIEENGDFLVDVFPERAEDDETSFEYFLQLVGDYSNKFNLSEIQDYKKLLLGEELEPEEEEE